MRPRTIRLAASVGGVGRQVEAWPCGVPGLAITPGIAPMCVTPAWTVTHVRSGSAVWRCIPSPEGALAVAQRLAPAADWTLGAAELGRGDARERLAEMGRHGHILGIPWSGTDLNDVTPDA